MHLTCHVKRPSRMRQLGKCIKCIANGAESQLLEKGPAILITGLEPIKIKNVN